MVFDANLVLIDGSATMGPTTDTAPTSLTRDGTSGAVVIDLGQTVRPRGDSEGVVHLTATLILPSAPTTYADTLTSKIQQSDNITFGWEDLAAFPTLYALTRLIEITVTTAFVAADLDAAISDSPIGDSGILRWMHPNALTVGKIASLIVAMDAAGDLFDDADATINGNDTGVGTMTKAAIVEVNPRLSGPGTWVRGFAVTKRYLRANVTASGGSNYGAVELLLGSHPFRNI